MSETEPPRHIRIRIACKDRPDEDVLIDAALDSEFRIVGRWPLYGRWAEHVDGRLLHFPVILREDGVLDFGPGQEHYSTNLREKRVVEGELTTVWTDSEHGQAGGDEWIYRIVGAPTLGKTEKR